MHRNAEGSACSPCAMHIPGPTIGALHPTCPGCRANAQAVKRPWTQKQQTLASAPRPPQQSEGWLTSTSCTVWLDDIDGDAKADTAPADAVVGPPGASGLLDKRCAALSRAALLASCGTQSDNYSPTEMSELTSHIAAWPVACKLAAKCQSAAAALFYVSHVLRRNKCCLRQLPRQLCEQGTRHMRMHLQRRCAGAARGQRLGLGYRCAAAQAAAARTQPAAAQAAVEPASAATASTAPRTSASGPAALVTARAAACLVAPEPAGKPCMRQGKSCTISAPHAQAAAVEQEVAAGVCTLGRRRSDWPVCLRGRRGLAGLLPNSRALLARLRRGYRHGGPLVACRQPPVSAQSNMAHNSVAPGHGDAPLPPDLSPLRSAPPRDPRRSLLRSLGGPVLDCRLTSITFVTSFFRCSSSRC